MFLMMNGKNFPQAHIPAIRERLLDVEDTKWPVLQAMQFKEPVIALVISLIVGQLGIDRFYIGDTGLGIAKLLTCGGIGIWTIVDWFLIMDAAREKNLERIQQILY